MVIYVADQGKQGFIYWVIKQIKSNILMLLVMVLVVVVVAVVTGEYGPLKNLVPSSLF